MLSCRKIVNCGIMKIIQTLLALQLLILTLQVDKQTRVEGMAVLGVDIGSEWMRIGLVKPGVPMEIVLNKETRRKTPMSVYTSTKERLIGEESLSAGIKKPVFMHKYFTRTLGAVPPNPVIADFVKDFPALGLQPDQYSPQHLVHHTGYTSEELLAMMLNHSRQLSEDFADFRPIKDMVITVPPYATQAERRAILRAADLVGIKVLKLINSNLAVALHYGTFQRETYKETPKTVLFYDMGATSTIATIVRFEIPDGKNTIPKVTILGTGFDRHLGGAHVDRLLARHIAKEFEKQQAEKNNKVRVLDSERAMAKLLKESNRVKNVLSANNEHYAHIESLIGDLDLKILVKRTDLEGLCDLTLFNKIPGLLREAIDAAKISREEIDVIVPVGGSSRLPKVREMLLVELGKEEYTTTINADESAAMGAVYEGAFLSKGFRIKEIQLQDASIYPIEISYEKRVMVKTENDTEPEEGEYKTKMVRKLLYFRSNQLPQKKIMTFKNITNNLILNASYSIDQSWLSSYNLGVLTQGQHPQGNNIMRLEINGIEDAFTKYDLEEFKGVKVHFSINENGIFSCASAEAVFEKISIEKSTLDSILGYFSSTPESEDKDKDKEGPNAESTADTNANTSDNVTLPPDSGNITIKTDSHKSTKPEVFMYPLEIIMTYLDYPDPSEESISSSKQKLLILALKDDEKRLLELAQNNLEAFIYDLKERLFRDETIAITNEEQRESMAIEIAKTSDWFFEQGSDTPKEEYNEKFKELKSHTVDIFIRLRESKELPKALKKLNASLNATEFFIQNMEQNQNVSSLVFTEGDFRLITRQYNQTMEWLANAIEEQAKMPPYENPKLTVSLVETQRVALENELRYLMGKLKNWRPPRNTEIPTSPPRPAPAQNESIGTENGDEETVIDIEEPDKPEQQQQQPEEQQQQQPEGEQKSEEQQNPEQQQQQQQELHIDLTSEQETNESTPESSEKKPIEAHTDL